MKTGFLVALALLFLATFAFAQEPDKTALTAKDINGLVLGGKVLSVDEISPIPVSDQEVTGFAFNHLTGLAYCTRDAIWMMEMPNTNWVRTPPASSRLLGKNDKAGSHFNGPLLWDCDAGRLALFRIYDDGRQAARELLLYDFLTRKLSPLVSEAWVEPACWSSDGKFLAYAVMDRPDSPRAGVWVLDMKTREKTRITPQPARALAFYKNNTVLWYQTPEPATYAYTFATGKTETLPGFPPSPWQPSPDGRYLSTLKGKNLEIRNLTTGNPVFSAPVEPAAAKVCWMPYNNDLIVFLDPKDRLQMTALSGPSQGMVREVTGGLMVDAFPSPPAQWSNKIQQPEHGSEQEQLTWLAFGVEGKLMVLRVWHRPFSANDKIALGQLRINESEVLLSNMKQVTLAALMFASDCDNTLPPADDFIRLLTPYLKDVALFDRPGRPNKPVVKICYKGAGVPLRDIEDPANTVIFKIDLGNKGVTLGFADGHARTCTREQAQAIINNPDNVLGPQGRLRQLYAP